MLNGRDLPAAKRISIAVGMAVVLAILFSTTSSAEDTPFCQPKKQLTREQRTSVVDGKTYVQAVYYKNLQHEFSHGPFAISLGYRNIECASALVVKRVLKKILSRLSGSPTFQSTFSGLRPEIVITSDIDFSKVYARKTNQLDHGKIYISRGFLQIINYIEKQNRILGQIKANISAEQNKYLEKSIQMGKWNKFRILTYIISHELGHIGSNHHAVDDGLLNIFRREDQADAFAHKVMREAGTPLSGEGLSFLALLKLMEIWGLGSGDLPVSNSGPKALVMLSALPDTCTSVISITSRLHRDYASTYGRMASPAGLKKTCISELQRLGDETSIRSDISESEKDRLLRKAAFYVEQWKH